MTAVILYGPGQQGSATTELDVAGMHATLVGARLDPHAPCCICIGSFDGVHRGHRALVARTIQDARARGVAAVAVTFDPCPDELLRGEGAAQRLLATEDRIAALLECGVDAVLVYRFTAELAARTPDAFVRELLLGIVSPCAVHVGTNFRFGACGAGTPATLAALGQACGFDVHAHELVRQGTDVVSSTRIRGLVAASHVREAADLLGRSHYVRGEVVHGRGEGTSFGFPTANVAVDAALALPAPGVYACYVACCDLAWPAAANVGAPPTFPGERRPFLEANLIGFAGDLYGRRVAVTFEEFLRPSRAFASLDELERVVRGNIDWVATHLGTGCVEVGR